MVLRTRAKPRSRSILPTKQPHHITFLVSLALAILGVVATQTRIDGISQHAFWIVVGAYVLLALGNLIVGL